VTPVRRYLAALTLATIAGSACAQSVVTVGPGQKLWQDHLENGRFLDQSFDLGPDTTFQIDGGRFGTVGRSNAPFDFQGSRVEILNGGSIITLRWNAENINLDVTSGDLLQDINIFGDSVVNITDGRINGSLTVEDETTLNLRGGAAGRNSSLTARRGGTLNILDGAIPERVIAVSGRVRITGGEPADETYIGLFSGADGTLANAELDAELEARDGSTVTIAKGRARLNAVERSQINVAGGTIDERGQAEWSTLHVTGGLVGESFRLNDSLLVQTGGKLAERMRACRSEMRIYGGEIAQSLDIDCGSIVQLYVKQVSLDGENVPLRPGQSVVIHERLGTLLEAKLARGTSAEFRLNDRHIDGEDHFDADAEVIVTRLGCPADLTTTGVSRESPLHGLPDGDTDLADLLFFVERWRDDMDADGTRSDRTTTDAPTGHPANGTPDGTVDLADLIYFINEWVNGANMCPPGA